MVSRPTMMAMVATRQLTTLCTCWSGLIFKPHAQSEVEWKAMKLNYAAAVAAALLVMGGAYSAEVSTEVMTKAQTATLQKTIETCAACHGVNGRSVSPTFPNLAAQTAPYIELQLHAFKDQTRADPDAQAYMWGMASQLNDASISELASYFSKQPAAQ